MDSPAPARAALAVQPAPPAGAAAGSPPSPGGRSLDEVERQAIVEVLESTGWNISLSSRILGVTRQTLRNKLQKYGLAKPGMDDGED